MSRRVLVGDPYLVSSFPYLEKSLPEPMTNVGFGMGFLEDHDLPAAHLAALPESRHVVAARVIR